MISNKFRMVYKVDGNLQLDSRDWSMYLRILNLPLNLVHSLQPNESGEDIFKTPELGGSPFFPPVRHNAYKSPIHIVEC